MPAFDDREVDPCRYCGGTPALFAGLMTCECGAVLGRHLDSAPEPSRDGSKERHCAPASVLYPCAASYVSARTAESRKAVKMQAWTGQANARNLVKNLTTLVAEASELGLCDSVTTRAKHIYADVAKDPHLRGTRRAGLIEGCIYAALQSQGCARTVDEMSAKDPGSRVISRGIKLVMRSVASKEAVTAPCSARAFLERHREDVLKAIGKDADRVADAAASAAALVDELGIACRFKPPSKAAACVLMTASSSVDRAALATALGISECTATSAWPRWRRSRRPSWTSLRLEPGAAPGDVRTRPRAPARLVHERLVPGRAHAARRPHDVVGVRVQGAHGLLPAADADGAVSAHRHVRAAGTPRRDQRALRREVLVLELVVPLGAGRDRVLRSEPALQDVGLRLEDGVGLVQELALVGPVLAASGGPPHRPFPITFYKKVTSKIRGFDRRSVSPTF